MKKVICVATVFAAVFILGTWACLPPNGTSNNPYMPNNPTVTPTPTGLVPTNTATAIPTITPPTSTYSGAALSATVTYGGSFNFGSQGTTILAGQAVIFDSSLNGHTVNIDNGYGTCYSNTTSFPVTLTFPSRGLFTFHCNYHGSCTSGCVSCSAMYGWVQVN